MDLRRRLLSFLNNDVDLAGSKMRRADGRGGLNFQMFMCKVRDVQCQGGYEKYLWQSFYAMQ